jgi:uncharacterized membrane protein YhaH (DUF805 family)
MTLLANAVTWICALATIITEGMSTKGQLDRNNRWFVSLLSLATIIHTSFLLMMAICEENAICLFLYEPSFYSLRDFGMDES